MSADIMQDLLDIQPPYSILWVPVISGTVDGIAVLVAFTALLLKTKSSLRETSSTELTIKIYGLLVALTFLGASGIAALLVAAPGMRIAPLVHLAAVMLSFAFVPYNKFSHLTCRFLALGRHKQKIGLQAVQKVGEKSSAHVGLPTRGTWPIREGCHQSA